MCHEVENADSVALSLPNADGQMLCLILMDVDTTTEGFAFSIFQRIVYCVSVTKACRFVALFYSKYYLLHADMCYSTKSNGKNAVDVLFGLWQIETNSITSLPPLLHRQRLIAVEQSIFGTSSEKDKRKV